MKKIFTLLFTAALALGAQASLLINVSDYGEISGDSLEIVVNEAELNPMTEKMVMEVEGSLLISDAVNDALAVSIIRSEAGLVDEFCCGTDCRGGNGETSQRGSYDVSGWVGPQDWYIHFTPNAAGANVTIRYYFSDGVNQKLLIVHFVYEGTGLKDVEADKTAREGVYTIFGQQLRPDNNTENLPAGMYIVGGKKTIIH